MADLFGEGDDEHNGGEGEEEEDAVEEEEDILDMGGDDTAIKDDELILMRFCPHDSSMLYPQENRQSKTLQYACRLCEYNEPAADKPLIYRNDRKKEVKNILHTVPSAISDDPTLARSNRANCVNCGHNEAVFFQSDVAQADSLALIFVCCNCDHKWVG
jgi:DNA-directed RNA polymerase II subunit RPB9